MKKIVKTIFIIALLLTCMACGKGAKEDDVTSTLPSGEEDMTTTTEVSEQPTTYEMETTTDPGLIPNSAGIVIREPEEETTKPDPETAGVKLGPASNNIHLADEDAKRLGVTKILVFQVESTATWDLDKDIVSKFNELLVTKYGCDFVVSFIGLGIGDYYYEMLAEMKNTEQADIMFAVAPGYYSKLVREGYFMDITEYLTTTEEGKKLYEAYPEEIWDMITLGDKIYGYTSREYTFGVQPQLICNKEMADKLGLEFKDDFSFYDIGEILAKVDLSKENIGNAVPLYMNGNLFIPMLGYTQLGNGVFVKENGDGEWVAFNATEDEEFIRLMKIIREYKEKGWLKTGNTAYQSLATGEFVFFLNAFSHFTVVDDKLSIDVFDSQTGKTKRVTYDVIPLEKYYWTYGFTESYIYGVTTWSEYKEEALKLITLINTEAELANLLAYGIENDHYIYRDKRVVALPSGGGNGMGIVFSVVNPAITHSTYVEPDNKREYLEDVLSNYKKSALLESFSTSEEYTGLMNEYDKEGVLEQIYEQGYTKLINGEYEDVEAAIAEINRMQKDAGIDALIDAFNEKFRANDK